MQLKLLFISIIFLPALSACNNSANTNASFCDTICLKDSLKFVNNNDSLKPYVYISAKNCMGDTVTWSYRGMGVNKKLPIGYKLNKDYIRCVFRDTACAWLIFNRCDNGRGYFYKFRFNKKADFT